MPRNLTPESLTYESFRHSQGGNLPQLAIFRYMWLEHRLAPKLDLTDEELGPYERFLGSAARTGSAVHLQSDHADGIAADIRENFQGLDLWRRTPDGRAIGRITSVDALNRQLLTNLAYREMQILEYEAPWLDKETGLPGDRPQRLAARVASGRASFLLYYGRDGSSTGYQEFDGLYRDLWTLAVRSEFEGTMDELSVAVGAAEMKHLGHLCLAEAA